MGECVLYSATYKPDLKLTRPEVKSEETHQRPLDRVTVWAEQTALRHRGIASFHVTRADVDPSLTEDESSHHDRPTIIIVHVP